MDPLMDRARVELRLPAPVKSNVTSAIHVPGIPETLPFHGSIPERSLVEMPFVRPELHRELMRWIVDPATPTAPPADPTAKILEQFGSRPRPITAAIADVATGRGTYLTQAVVNRYSHLRTQADAMLGVLLGEAVTQGQEHLPRAPRTVGNKADLLVRNEQYLPQLFADLADSKDIEAVLIHQFNWEDNGGGRQMIDRLKQLATEGKDVRIMVDAWGFREQGWGTAKRLEQELEGAGVKLERAWGFKRPFKRKDGWEHRKIIQITRKDTNRDITYLGGLGFGTKYDTWSDTMVRVQGPSSNVSSLHGMAAWRDLTGSVDAALGARIADEIEDMAEARVLGGLEGFAQGKAAVTLLENNPGVDLAATEAFLDDAATAKHRLWATSTYITSPEAVQAMIDAANRMKAAGRTPDVKLVVTGLEAGNDTKIIKWARTFYKEMLDAGVEIVERKEILHAKGWIKDAEHVTVGSMNLAHSSMVRAREIMARIEDASMVAKYEAFHTALRRTADQPALTDEVRKLIPAAICNSPGRLVTHADLESRGLKLLTWARKATGLRW